MCLLKCRDCSSIQRIPCTFDDCDKIVQTSHQCDVCKEKEKRARERWFKRHKCPGSIWGFDRIPTRKEIMDEEGESSDVDSENEVH